MRSPWAPLDPSTPKLLLPLWHQLPRWSIHRRWRRWQWVEQLVRVELWHHMFFDEFNHLFWCNIFQRNCFNPLGEIISGHQDKLMIFTGWRIYLADQINSPSSKRPRLDYGIHGWRMNSLHAPKLLTFLATSVICEAIFQHRRPKISIPPDHPFHLIGRLMGSTDPFMNFTH